MISVRRHRLTDLPQVMRIERASFGAEGYGSSTFLAHAFRDRGGFYVAQDEQGQVVGYVLVRLGLPWLGPRRGGITSVAVAPAHRRQGVGRALMCAALAHLQQRHAERADLEVSVTNRAAQSLYESLGFKRAKLLPDYYGLNRDGLQMVLDLRTCPADLGRYGATDGPREQA